MDLIDPSPPGGRLSPWAPLRHPLYRAVFIAQLASNVGTLMQTTAAAWSIGDLGGSRTLVALVQTAAYLPVFLFGVPGGALADIVDRRRLLVVTQSWMMTVALALTALAFLDLTTPALVLVAIAAVGCGTAFNNPAWHALQPDLVPRREIAQAMSLNSVTFNVGRAIGPAFAGVLLAGAGPEWVFLLNALSFIGIIAVLHRCPPSVAASDLPRETFLGAVRGAIRYGVHAPLLRSVLIRAGLFMIPASALQALLPVVVRESLGLDSSMYGVFLGCFGFGAIGAAVLRPRAEERLSRDAMLRVASAIVIVALLVQGVVAVPLLVAPVLVLAGFAWTLATTTTNVAAQSTLYGWVRARGMGLYLLVLTGSIAFGGAIFGALAALDVALAHVSAAAVLVLGLLLTREPALDRTERVDISAIPGEVPLVVLQPDPSDGPILVTITYRVPTPAMEEYLSSMEMVRRHRMRTGASRWMLYRDLADPDRFVEEYTVPTWGAHVRQHHRATVRSATDLYGARPFIDPTVPPSHLIDARAGVHRPAASRDDRTTSSTGNVTGIATDIGQL